LDYPTTIFIDNIVPAPEPIQEKQFAAKIEPPEARVSTA
jgi:hypothetical protein